MGHIYGQIELSNPRLPNLHALSVRALVDTGSQTLCIPESIALQLELATDSLRDVTLADGRVQKVRYVGPIRVTFGNRSCFVGAFVLGDDVLLGAIPMEDMDLVIVPSRKTIAVNPLYPNTPHAIVKASVREHAPSSSE